MKKFRLKNTAMLLAALLVMGNSAMMLGGEASALEVAADTTAIQATTAAADEGVSLVESRLVAASASDSHYSSYDAGYVTSVKYQQDDPTCWIFTGVSLMETAILKNGLASSVNLSEEQIKCSTLTKLAGGEVNPLGTKTSFNLTGSGNFDLFSAAMMRGVSPVQEGGKYPSGYRLGPTSSTSYKFSNGDPLPSVDDVLLTPDYNLLKTHWIHNFGTLDTDDGSTVVCITDAQRQALVREMKQAIIDYGAVTCSIYSTPLKADNRLFLCCKGKTLNNLSNHSVTIVGWDDSVDKNLFGPDTPNANGAFLCKNSWSENWGKAKRAEYGTVSQIAWPEGYFWLSYEDVNCGSYCGAVCEVEVANTDQIIYQHDKQAPQLFSWDSDDIGTSTIASMYEIESGKEVLESISFYSQNPGTGYTAWIATAESKPANAPAFLNSCESSKEWVLLGKGTTDNYGYYTIDLPENILLTDAEPVFFIKVETTNSYPFCCEELDFDNPPQAGSNFTLSSSGWGFSSLNISGHGQTYTTHTLKVRTAMVDSSLTIPIYFEGSGGTEKATTANITVTNAEDSSDVIYTGTVRIPAGSGRALFLYDNCPTGVTKVDITVSKPGYTSYVLDDYRVGGSIPGNVRLYAGDLDGNGFVNSRDYSILVSAYNKSKSDEGYVAHYDFDENGFINSRDVSILIGSLIAQQADMNK